MLSHPGPEADRVVLKPCLVVGENADSDRVDQLTTTQKLAAFAFCGASGERLVAVRLDACARSPKVWAREAGACVFLSCLGVDKRFRGDPHRP